jgi:hypothetical protein
MPKGLILTFCAVFSKLIIADFATGEQSNSEHDCVSVDLIEPLKEIVVAFQSD